MGKRTDEPEQTNQTTPELTEEMRAMVEAKVAEFLKAAEEKYDAIIEAAESKVNNGGNKVADDVAKANAELEEYVEIKLFKDNGKYKDDVYVSVNGENCVIKRGVRTKIKKKFALVLEQSDMQDYMTSQLMETKTAEYEASAREHGM